MGAENEPRRYLTVAETNEVVNRQQWRCAACGCDLREPATMMWLQLDHIIPLAVGGGQGLDNWQALCRPCHDAKTFGSATPLSGDLSKIAKTKRVARKEAEFRERVAGREPGQKRVKRGTIKSRGFQKRET